VLWPYRLGCALRARFCHVVHVVVVGEGIVGEVKFAFNNMREATLSHELFGRWPPFAGACAICHGFLLRFRQRQGRIRPRKG
jgi:hypothetical protein